MKYSPLIILATIVIIIFASPEARAGSVTVMWEFPTHREDNVLIKDGELSHTKVYFHETVKNHWTDAKVMHPDSSLTIDKPAGNYEIFATVVDIDGRESAASNKVQKIIPDEPIVIELTRPNPPTIIIIDN